MKYEYRKAPAVREYSADRGQVAQPGDMRIIAKDIPCQEACPARTNVPLYIEHLASGDSEASYRINLECNVFPGVLGRICTRPCEDRCRHNWTNVNGPVTICHLKRAAADQAAEKAKPPAPYFDASGKKVAVIGGGPAGLTAARELKRLGHDVVLFERQSKLGGMMRYDIPGVPHEAVISGLDFMARYNNGDITHLDGDVVVVGGGFTAVDCSRSSARAARRLVGEGRDVSIMYRRIEQFMAANKDELEEIRRENITIRTLVTPVAGTVKGGKLQSITFTRNMLAQGTDNGKPRIAPVPDSAFEIPCTHLIVAIGQTQEFEILPEGVSLTEGFHTTDEKVFVAGDFATGSDNVIKAVANGKAVARQMDAFLMGRDRLRDVIEIQVLDNDGDTGRLRDHDIIPAAAMSVIPVPQRAEDDNEVEIGFTEDGTQVNALRCYFCHYKFEIDQDKCIHCDWCIQAAPRECIKRVSRLFHDQDGVVETVVEANLAHEATYIWIDSNECIRCGKCLRVCPTGAISMKKVERIVDKRSQ